MTTITGASREDMHCLARGGADQPCDYDPHPQVKQIVERVQAEVLETLPIKGNCTLSNGATGLANLKIHGDSWTAAHIEVGGQTIMQWDRTRYPSVWMLEEGRCLSFAEHHCVMLVLTGAHEPVTVEYDLVFSDVQGDVDLTFRFMDHQSSTLPRAEYNHPVSKLYARLTSDPPAFLNLVVKFPSGATAHIPATLEGRDWVVDFGPPGSGATLNFSRLETSYLEGPRGYLVEGSSWVDSSQIYVRRAGLAGLRYVK